MGGTTRVTDMMQEAIANTIQSWLADHPLLLWMLAHPLWMLAIALIVVFLVWGLLNAIASVAERVWVVIVQFPFRVLRWGAVSIFNLLRGKPGEPVASPFAAKTSKQHRVEEILQRLEALKQEQDTLMQEIRGLLRSDIAG